MFSNFRSNYRFELISEINSSSNLFISDSYWKFEKFFDKLLSNGNNRSSSSNLELFEKF